MSSSSQTHCARLETPLKCPQLFPTIMHSPSDSSGSRKANSSVQRRSVGINDRAEERAPDGSGYSKQLGRESLRIRDVSIAQDKTLPEKAAEPGTSGNRVSCRGPLPCITRSRKAMLQQPLSSNSSACQDEQQRQATRLRSGLRELREEMGKLQAVFQEDSAHVMEVIREVAVLSSTLEAVRGRRSGASSRAIHAATPSTMVGMSCGTSAKTSGRTSPMFGVAPPTPQVINDALLNARICTR